VVALIGFECGKRELEARKRFEEAIALLPGPFGPHETRVSWLIRRATDAYHRRLSC
jgi:hypothetical protein